MAQKEEVGFIERHLEKIIVGVVALVVIYLVLAFVISSPMRIPVTLPPGMPMFNDSYSPGEVDEALVKISDSVKSQLENAKPAEVRLPDYAGQLRQLRENPLDLSLARPYIDLQPGRPPLRPAVVSSQPTAKLEMAMLTPLPTPDKPLVSINREVYFSTSTGAVGKATEAVVVHGAAVFEHGKLLNQWKPVLERTLSPAPVFVSVQVQRQQRQVDGQWGEPAAVSASPLVKEVVLPAFDGRNFEPLLTLIRNELSQPAVQESIVTPPFYPIVGADRQGGTWLIHKPRTRVSEGFAPESATAASPAAATPVAPAAPVMPSPRPTPVPRSGDHQGLEFDPYAPPPVDEYAPRPTPTPAAPALVPTPTPTPVAAPVVLTSAIPTLSQLLMDPRGIMEVWFHDATLTEGPEYRYRLRLVVVNPLLGRTIDASDADAKIVTIETPWSDWSDVVSAKNTTKYFLAGSSEPNQTMVVDVFTQAWGQWHKRTYVVSRGDPIGRKETLTLTPPGGGEPQSVTVNFSTGAVAMDFDFRKKIRIPGTELTRTTTEMLIRDAEGQLRWRTSAEDETSKEYKDLNLEVRPLRPTATPRPPG